MHELCLCLLNITEEYAENVAVVQLFLCWSQV